MMSVASALMLLFSWHQWEICVALKQLAVCVISEEALPLRASLPPCRGQRSVEQP